MPCARRGSASTTRRGVPTLLARQRDLLIAMEERVSQHCLTHGGLPQQQVQAVLDHRGAVKETIARANAGDELGDGTAADDESEAWYARMWGAWTGRGRGLVRGMCRIREAPAWACGRPADGGAARPRRRRCQPTARAHRAACPTSWCSRPGAGSEATLDELRLVGYSPFDPLVLPASLLADLRRLDGRPMAQVRADIEHSGGTRLDDGLLAQLYDFGVAVAPAPPRP